MKPLLLTLSLALSPSLAFAECPALPDRSDRHTELLALVAQAQNEMKAQDLNNQLWEIWTTAPDDIAQEMLERGMGKRRAYDFLGAISDFDALIAYCPHYAEGYNQRAFIHFLREDYESALTDLRRTLEITPDHIGALSGVALSLLNMGLEREGQLALRHALTLNPWLPERFQLRELPPAEGNATEESPIEREL